MSDFNTQMTVTIGRNVGSEPMSDLKWSNFIEDVLKINDLLTEAPLFSDDFDATSKWQDEPEESVIFVWILPRALDQETLKNVQKHIRKLVRDYSQDAISFGYGVSELLTEFA